MTVESDCWKAHLWVAGVSEWPEPELILTSEIGRDRIRLERYHLVTAVQ